MTQPYNPVLPYIDAQRQSQLPGRGIPWLDILRGQAIGDFERQGFPTVKDEAWRYTNVAPMIKQGYLPVTAVASGITQELLQPLTLPELDAWQVVFINGQFTPRLSRLDGLPETVTVMGLAEAMMTRDQALTGYLGQLQSVEPHGFTALNTAFLCDGAYVHVSPNVALSKPLQLIYVTDQQADGAFLQPRNLIVADEGSQATVIEHYVGMTDGRYLTNAVTEIALNKNAHIEHYRLQQEGGKAFHVGGLFAHQQRDSRLRTYAIDLGGQLVRNDVASQLLAEGAACEMNGLYLADGRQHIDNHTRIDHMKPQTVSREFYKGILDGRARAVFRGRVVVQQDAQKTDAEQLNNNLLLSRDAEIDTKPQLEIYADDVKCSHGATVGQLDSDALFYLRSRAIDEAVARDLLTYAFANDILHRIQLKPIRVYLEHRLMEKLLHGRNINEVELV